MSGPVQLGFLYLPAVCSWKGADPNTLQRVRRKEDLWIDEPLFPEILRTCRLVYEEATPILYQENTFVFSSNRIDPELDHSHRNAEDVCQRLMSYRIDEDDVEDKDAIPYTDIPSPVNNSNLAAFIRRIGPYSSSLIRELEFVSSSPAEATDDIIVATHLCFLFTPKLESLLLRVKTKEGTRWDESPEYWHPNLASPWYFNGPFGPMFEALEQFVEKVTWLQVLEYDYDRSTMQCKFEEPHAMEKMRGLEETVEKQAAVSKAPGSSTQR
ncbi:MAG: hypothetical protein Q9169_001925 [Polycauliona sp. 2 TL-2023]